MSAVLFLLCLDILFGSVHGSMFICGQTLFIVGHNPLRYSIINHFLSILLILFPKNEWVPRTQSINTGTRYKRHILCVLCAAERWGRGGTGGGMGCELILQGCRYAGGEWQPNRGSSQSILHVI